MIAGKKVRLRRPPDRGPEHEFLVDWRNDPANKPFFNDEEPLSLDSHLAWWDGVRKDPKQRFYLIETVDMVEGFVSELIGTTSLFDIDWRNRTAQYGRLLIIPGYRTRGFASEAEFLLLDYAFNHLNLHKVWTDILAYNEAALALHAKFKFKDEGRLCQHVFKGGKYVDVILLGLLAEEFRDQRLRLASDLGLEELRRSTGKGHWGEATGDSLK